MKNGSQRNKSLYFFTCKYYKSMIHKNILVITIYDLATISFALKSLIHLAD